MPSDVGGRRGVLGAIDGLELHRVGKTRLLFGAVRVLHDPCVGLQDVELLAREDHDAGVLILASTLVPGLDDPVLELLGVARGRGGRSGDRLGGVDVEGSVARGVGAAGGVVHDADALGAGERCTPPALELDHADDPVAVDVVVVRCPVAPLVHDVGVVGGVGLVIVGRDAVVDHECVGVEEGPVVEEPAHELVLLARAGGQADGAAVGAQEVHLLIVGTPAEGGVGAGVGAQEHAGVHEAPLGVDRDALGHGGEGVGLGACLVDVPAVERVARRGLGNVVLGTTLVVVSQAAVVGDAGLHLQFATARGVGHRVVVAVDVHSVLVEDVVVQGLEADVKVVGASPTAQLDSIIDTLIVLVAKLGPRRTIGAVSNSLVAVVLVSDAEGAVAGRCGICGVIQRGIAAISVFLIELNVVSASAGEAVEGLLGRPSRENEGVQEGRAGPAAIIIATILRIAVIPPAAGGPGVAVAGERGAVEARHGSLGVPAVVLAVQEGQRDEVAIVVHVGDRVALGGDRHIGVGTAKVEALVGAIGIGAHINGLTDGAVLDRDGLVEVVGLGAVGGVLGVADVLLPDEDGVAGRGGSRPLRVDMRGVAQRATERKALGKGRVSVPAVEGVAVALHLDRWHGSGRAVLDELGRHIGALVLVEDEPVTLGSVHREDDAAVDLDARAVGVDLAGLVALDAAATKGHEPTLEVLLRVGHVRLVDGVVERRVLGVGADLERHGAKGGAAGVKVGDVVLLHELGVVRDLCAIGEGVVQLGRNRVADVGDAHALGVGAVAVGGHPALEEDAIGKLACAGVIEDLLQVVALLDVDGGDGGVTAHEVDLDARVVARLDDHVDGELVGVEGDGAGGRDVHVGGGDGLDGAGVGDMEDVGARSVDARVAEGDGDGSLGLDLLALEPEGNVDSLNRRDLIVGHGVDAVEEALGRDVLEAKLHAIGERAVGGVDDNLGGADVAREALLVIGDVLLGLGLLLGRTLNLSLSLGVLGLGGLVGRDGLGIGLSIGLYGLLGLGLDGRLGSRLGLLGRHGRLRLRLGSWLWGCLLWLRGRCWHLLHGRRRVGDYLLLRTKRFLRLLDRVRHSLEREQLQNEAERKHPGEGLPQQGEQLAHPLVHPTSFLRWPLGCGTYESA